MRSFRQPFYPEPPRSFLCVGDTGRSASIESVGDSDRRQYPGRNEFLGLGWLIGWWYPLTELTKPAQRVAVERVRQWGSPVLLLSWVPFIGDPLCIAAGWLRMTWVRALVFIGIGKGCRYAVLLALLHANG